MIFQVSIPWIFQGLEGSMGSVLPETVDTTCLGYQVCWGMVGGISAYFLTWMVPKNGGFACKIEQIRANEQEYDYFPFKLPANEPLAGG